MQIRLFNANNAAFLGVTLAFGAVAAAMVMGVFGEWREPDCQSYPVQSVASPSGNLRAVQEQEACGSTDRLVTTVSVRSSQNDSQSLVFRSITGSALGAMSVGQRSLPLALRWRGDAELTIAHPADVKPEAASAAAPGLKVTYVPQVAR
jgi:hypothetical protein